MCKYLEIIYIVLANGKTTCRTEKFRDNKFKHLERKLREVVNFCNLELKLRR